jgi:hypothetical protein
MATKREQVHVVFKSKGADEAMKTGIKLGIPETQMKRVIRAMTNGTWKPPMKRGSGEGKKPAKAKAAPKAKAPAKAKAAPKAKAASKAKAKTKAAPKAKLSVAAAVSAAEKKRVKMTYDKTKVGTVVREGPEASVIRIDGSNKDQTVSNKTIVAA